MTLGENQTMAGSGAGIEILSMPAELDLTTSEGVAAQGCAAIAGTQACLDDHRDVTGTSQGRAEFLEEMRKHKEVVAAYDSGGCPTCKDAEASAFLGEARADR